MICSTCKEAGQLNKNANTWPDDSPERERFYAMAAEMHKSCEAPGTADYGGCTCQHVVGDVINRERIRDD